MENTIDRRADLVSALVRRQMRTTTECREAVKEAVHIIVEDLFCDLKFDPDLLNELLMAYGWTPDDVTYFGISDLFETEGE